MRKSFTVRDVHHKEISPGKGSIIWLLEDEKGLPRKVNAITDVAPDGVIQKMRSVYRREAFLVERLQQVVEGQTFIIDFTAYNTRENYAPRDAYADPRNVYADMRTRESVGKLASTFTKAAMIAGIFVVLWFFYSAVTDVSQMRLNLSHMEHR